MSVRPSREAHIKGPHRRDMTAISEYTAQVALDACSKYINVAILDAGSGFSSLVLRYAYPKPPALIYTVDDSWRWLGQTLCELELQGLRTDHCVHWDVLAQTWDKCPMFDVVLYDMGDTAFRIETAPIIWSMMRPDATIILDDWQMEHYRKLMAPFLASQGWVIVHDGSAHKDQYGRYPVVAKHKGYL